MPQTVEKMYPVYKNKLKRLFSFVEVPYLPLFLSFLILIAPFVIFPKHVYHESVLHSNAYGVCCCDGRSYQGAFVSTTARRWPRQRRRRSASEWRGNVLMNKIRAIDENRDINLSLCTVLTAWRKSLHWDSTTGIRYGL